MIFLWRYNRPWKAYFFSTKRSKKSALICKNIIWPPSSKTSFGNINLPDVERLIRNELDGPGKVSGYRGMWHTLRITYGVYVPRQEVAHLLKIRDPDGVEERKRYRLKKESILPLGPITVGMSMATTNWNLMVSQSMEPSTAVIIFGTSSKNIAMPSLKMSHQSQGNMAQIW